MICDLAETYQILNYRELPVNILATLSVGLRANSRVKMKLSNSKIPLSDILLVNVVDNLRILIWQKTKDGQRNMNRPKLLINTILDKNNKQDIVAFENHEEFEKMRKKIAGGE